MNIFEKILPAKAKDKLKNKNLFKRGGYAAALIALVAVGLVILNILTVALVNRFDINLDLSFDKKNSISDENREYISSLEKEITLSLLADSPEEYTDGHMEYYAQQKMYSDTTGEYYRQTMNLLKLYPRYSDKITLNYVDYSDAGMATLLNKYEGEGFYYGDIIVECSFESNGKQFNRHKVLHFTDLYEGSDETGLASMGYGAYTISGNKLETALTSAIAAVTAESTKKIGYLSGHGVSKNMEFYTDLLKINNYEVEEISGVLLSNISDEYDALIIAAPTSDFSGDEVNILSEYLENGGKLGKSIIYFASSGYQNLPVLKSFLAEWCINFEDGIVLETNDYYRYYKDDFSTYGIVPQSGSIDILSNISACVAGHNVPMYAGKNSFEGRTATSVLTTSSSVVKCPISTDISVKPESEEYKTYSACVVSVDEDVYESEAVESKIVAFSSEEFLDADFMANGSSNKLMIMNAAAYTTGSGTESIVFDSKTLDVETFAPNVVLSRVVFILFVFVLPIALIVMAIVVYIRRKNR